jgi:hypothetical protein
MPRAPLCIDKDDKITILWWFQDLKFPDAYAANISHGVNLVQKRILGLKSHDFHIFVERLLPVELLYLFGCRIFIANWIRRFQKI